MSIAQVTPSEQEGVIKYQLQHRIAALPELLPLSEINAWRTVLFRLGLIGQRADKYGGLGFGNLSCRLKGIGDNAFVISGTQTGHLAELDAGHYAIVTAAIPLQNRLESFGLCQPSSEALTHGMVYQQHHSIQAVIHVHSPELWRTTAALKLPHTDLNIAYGTPDMAAAVAELFSSGQLAQAGVFSMLGHEDGVVSFGLSLADAAILLIRRLADALYAQSNS
jgi:ribulose-5-phosphate 4-epimerase/fuculose-1-phosphate aldolase